MVLPGWTLDHVGIAVEDLESAIAQYLALTGASVGARETLTQQGVALAFIETPGTQVELLAPLSTESTLGRFVAKRGPGLHHVCYRVSDVEEEIGRMSAMGLRLIDRIPRHGARSSRIAFIHPESCGGVLTEVCDYIPHS